MTQVQDNATEFASRPDSYIAQACHAAVREATEALVGGRMPYADVEDLVAFRGDPDRATAALMAATQHLAAISDSTAGLDEVWADYCLAVNRHGGNGV